MLDLFRDGFCICGGPFGSGMWKNWKVAALKYFRPVTYMACISFMANGLLCDLLTYLVTNYVTYFMTLFMTYLIIYFNIPTSLKLFHDPLHDLLHVEINGQRSRG